MHGEYARLCGHLSSEPKESHHGSHLLKIAPRVCCADNENIGCLQLTRVGSRRIVQIGACIAIILSVIGQPSLLLNSCIAAAILQLSCLQICHVCVHIARQHMSNHHFSANGRE